MWQLFDSNKDISFIREGDYVDISFTPHSQKHFMDPDYDYYFPHYQGKVLKTSKNLDELLILDLNNELVKCINRAGTSGFITAKYCRNPETNPFESLVSSTDTD